MAQDPWCCYEPRRPCKMFDPILAWDRLLTFVLSLTAVVITSILARLRLSLVTQRKVKRQVSLQLEELVYSVVHRRRRIRQRLGFACGNTCLCYGAGLKDCVAYGEIHSHFHFAVPTTGVTKYVPLSLNSHYVASPRPDLPQDWITLGIYPFTMY